MFFVGVKMDCVTPQGSSVMTTTDWSKVQRLDSQWLVFQVRRVGESGVVLPWNPETESRERSLKRVAH